MRAHLFGMINTAKSVEYTYHSVYSFLLHTPLYSDDLLVIIDNDCSLGMLEATLAQHQNIVVWKNSEPQGFAENANDLLLEALKRESDLFLLNNDLIFTSNWINPLLTDSSAILSPVSNREFSYEDPILSLPPSLSLEEYLGNEARLEELSALHRTRFSGKLARAVLPYFCVKIPYSAYARIGAFDTSFGNAGAEDFDYCIRAHLMGIETSFILDSYVLHFGGRSSWAEQACCKERQAHVKSFMNAFKAKWGQKIFDLVFYSSLEGVQEERRIADLLYENDFNSVVKSLLA